MAVIRRNGRVASCEKSTFDHVTGNQSSLPEYTMVYYLVPRIRSRATRKLVRLAGRVKLGRIWQPIELVIFPLQIETIP